MARRAFFMVQTRDQRLDESISEYQLLDALLVGELFATNDAQAWLQPRLRAFLKSDEKQCPSFEEVKSLSRRLGHPPKLSSGELFRLLIERLRCEEYPKLVAEGTSLKVKDDKSAQIQSLLKRQKSLGAEIFEMISVALHARSAMYEKRYRKPQGYFIGAATLGYMKAMPRYVPGKGPFFNYARIWIDSEINSAQRDEYLIHTPRHVYEEFRQLENREIDLASKLNRPPTVQELAHSLDKTVAAINLLKEQCPTIVSLDAPLDDGELGETWHERIADPEPVDEIKLLRDRQLLVVALLKHKIDFPWWLLPKEFFPYVAGRMRPPVDIVSRLREVGMAEIKQALAEERINGG
jgi:DNA-directed RNA polymerase specialized sigma subunit